jgi:hypothetical protein
MKFYHVNMNEYWRQYGDKIVLKKEQILASNTPIHALAM